jgi:hypothetical protein
MYLAGGGGMMMIMIIIIMSVGRDYVSKLQPQMGLMFIASGDI